MKVAREDERERMVSTQANRTPRGTVRADLSPCDPFGLRRFVPLRVTAVLTGEHPATRPVIRFADQRSS